MSLVDCFYPLSNSVLFSVFQVRVHLYQARNIPAADSNGLCDPYLKIKFMDQVLFMFMSIGMPVTSGYVFVGLCLVLSIYAFRLLACLLPGKNVREKEEDVVPDVLSDEGLRRHLDSRVRQLLAGT